MVIGKRRAVTVAQRGARSLPGGDATMAREATHDKNGSGHFSLPPCAAQCRIKVATYNIHIGIGRDGQYKPQRIASVIRELDADVVALQEVPLGASGFDMLAYLRDACALHAIAGPTLKTSKGDYGNAILTRFSAADIQCVDLSVPRREPRGAIAALLDCHGMPLRLIATHLGLRPAERRHQIRSLLLLVHDAKAVPTVLLGDLNEWFLWGRPVRWLHKQFKHAPAPASFPAGRPMLALDRIWVRPRQAMRHLAVHASALARVASDHLPVSASLDFDAAHLTHA